MYVWYLFIYVTVNVDFSQTCYFVEYYALAVAGIYVIISLKLIEHIKRWPTILAIRLSTLSS